MTRTFATRMFAATALGIAANTLVLLFMQALIRSDPMALEDPPSAGTISFLPKIEETPPERQKELPEVPPPAVVPPPPPDLAIRDPAGTLAGPEFTRPRVTDPGGPIKSGLADGDALPVVKVRPVYPARAEQRGIEGFVLVEFTIDPLGRVVDVRVLDAQPRGMFERAAVEAVERFRYKPRVVNGEPLSVSGVQHLVTFQLGS